MVTLSWAVAGAIAAFSAALVWPTQGTVSVESLGPSLLLAGLAGAVIGRLQSLPIAFSASLGIGVVEQVVRSKYPTGGQAELVLGVIVVLALLLQKPLSRREKVTGDWARLAPDPVPTAYRQVFLIRLFPWVVGVAAFGYAAYLAFGISNTTASVLTVVVGAAIIGLSVIVVTGLAGQLSLGQYAFAGIGAVASVVVSQRTGFFDLGLVTAAVAGGVVAALLGIPGLRLRGLAFAVTTLAFSLITSTWLLKQDFMLGDGLAPGKPIVGPWELSTAKGYYLFSLAVLAIALFLAANVRRTGLGRLARALRDNEDAARAFSVAASRRKLQVFAVSGALAGIGGSVIGHSQSSLTANVFPAGASIDVVAIAAVGGLGVLIGPILGSLYIVGLPLLAGLDTLGRAAVSLGWLILVVVAPGGFGGFLVQVRNRFYDVLARISGVDPGAARAADRSGVPDRAMRGTDLTALRPVSGPAAAVVAPQLGADGSVGRLPEGSDAVLSVRGLARSFGGVRAVRGVDLDVRRGEILGIIGPNGAGKTTLFEIVAGFTAPDEGKVVFDGVDVTRMAPEARARQGLVRSFQSSALFPTFTVLETVMVACEQRSSTNAALSLAGWSRPDRRKQTRALELLEVMGLTPIARRPVAQLATGTRRMVELTCMLALEPTVLLLDEPAGGLAQSEGQALVALLQAIRTDLGTTVVIVEHDLPLLFQVSDRLVAMELGQVIAAGSPEDVRNHPDVVRSYLGGDITAVERSGALVQA
jgi:ABC-type branched-subunit amino acid transport system ATPase component/ABC-type branched-subunit amino acid transport system permease subunit